MSIFRPSELHAFLEELGISAKKSLSQNFLIDGNILDKICTLAEVAPGDRVLEIGPGPGALTQALLKKGAHVTAIEMDHVFATHLKRLDGNLTVIEGDFLALSLETLLQGNQRFKIVANLPYQITTPILAKLVPLHSLISSITVMVQREVAKRFVAKPNTKDYSSFTLFLEYYGKTTYGFTVEPTCFYPRPGVRSAVCRIDLSASYQLPEEAFFQLTRTAFQQRRKMLRASLKSLFQPEHIESALQALNLTPTARPEQLSLENFIALFHTLYSSSSTSAL
ncbi:MAG: 16S rRNA (adenine(1518)-N(6)/adenine(1519)-N(6))-dimethyltransferase RsmA [Chlamydiota bacterium]